MAGCFVWYGTAAARAAGPTFVFGNIVTDTTWTKENSPYVVSTYGVTNVDATLTIEPGVIVKFYYNFGGLLVRPSGRLVANGSADEHIVFTSYYDDSAGGDTNEDGTVTIPQRGDWPSLKIDGRAEASYVDIRYGGNNKGSVVASEGATLSLSDSTVEKSLYSSLVLWDTSVPTIERVELTDGGGYGVESYLSSLPGGILRDVVVRGHGWGAMVMHPGTSLVLENVTFIDNTPQTVSVTNGQVVRDTTWPLLEGAVYFISGEMEVLPGATLTLEPGVIVKGEARRAPDVSHSRLLVRGRLVALGTVGRPIIFTSSADDSIGGDTNGDGGATVPLPGDWGGIRFESSFASTLGYFEMHYGGSFFGDFEDFAWQTVDTTCLNLQNSQVLFSHLQVDNCQNVIMLVFGSSAPVIQNSQFSGGYTGIHSSSALPWTVTNSSFSNSINYALYVEEGTAQVDARNNDWGSDTGPVHVNNPGGQGQQIVGDALFDPWVGKTQQIDPVILIPGILGSWQAMGASGPWVLDPILHTYDDLWRALKEAGYEVGSTLFALPYNWRQDNVLTSLELKNKIEQVKQICGCNKVDLVAHSMGGLVARSYIQGVDYDNDVDQVVFLGTPQKGSPESYLRWEAAEGFPSDPFGFVMKTVFQNEALRHGYSSLVNYIRERVISVEQLLPIGNYLKEASTGDFRSYPTNYPRNTYLENLNVDPAVNLLKSRVNGVNIIGDAGENSTLNYIRVVPDPNTNDEKWVHGLPESANDFGLELGRGDKTVPAYSADSLGFGFGKLVLESKHGQLPTNAQLDVIEILTGQRPTEEIHSGLITKLLFVIIRSPADIQVVDPQGSRVGKDFTGGGLLAEVPGSFYTGYDTDIEFVTIPNPIDGEYQVRLEGTGVGSYTVETSAIDDTQAQTASFTGFVDTGIQEGLNFDYNAEQNTIEPPVPQDVTPPVIIITSPENGRVYTHQDTITVGYSVTDDTGVQSSKATFQSDPREVTNGEAIDLFLEPIGTHKLIIDATDYLNNSSQAVVEFEVGATLNSLIQDIARADSLSWFKDKNVKNLLTLEVKVIQRLKKTVDKKKALRAFQIELVLFRRLGKINQQALGLLNGDAKYLIEHL